MVFLSFRKPLSRKQCVILLLSLTFAAWSAAVFKYAEVRPSLWRSVEARVLDIHGSSAKQARLAVYEFSGEPYVAMLPSGVLSDFSREVSLYVNVNSPSQPFFSVAETSRLRMMRSGVLVLISAFALYLCSRLLKTLDVERMIPQNIGEIDSLLEEFGGASGWSDAFVELLERQADQSERTTRASGSTGPTLIG